MFNDGRIGLLETKEGESAQETGRMAAGLKAKGLYDYIQEETKKGKKIRGGIVTRRRDGTWIYNDNKEYHYDPNNLSDWKTLEL